MKFAVPSSGSITHCTSRSADQLTAFFAHDTVLRIRLADDVDDQMLCIAIDVGDEVIGPFLARFYSVRGFVVLAIRLPALRAARTAIVSIGCMGIFQLGC